MPLVGEEGEFPEYGVYGRRGSDAAYIGPTLFCCVVEDCADVGYQGRVQVQKGVDAPAERPAPNRLLLCPLAVK